MQHVLYTETDHKLCARVLLSHSPEINNKSHPRTRAGATEPTRSALILRQGLIQCTVVPAARFTFGNNSNESNLLTPAGSGF